MEEQVQEALNLNLLALTTLLLLGFLTWSLPRRFAACPLLIATCLVALEQQIIVFGMHFFVFRVIILTGILRVVWRGETVHLKWTRLDRLFTWWIFLSVGFGAMSKPSGHLLINLLGDAYNAAGSYFFFRCVIVNIEDIMISVRTLAVLCIPVAVSMLVEKTTMYNMLSLLGGGPEIAQIREGHIRCQGAFRHPILAGTFGASLLPIFAALFGFSKKKHMLALAAMASTVVIAVTASSSGALMALFAAFAGLILWRYRNQLPILRAALIATLLALALAMNAPVWYLLAKLSGFTGGEGWHRAWLIDQAISHFDEWWLFGTTYTAHWGPAGEVIAADPNMMDITNHYVMEGVRGGMMKLGFFLVIIVECFNTVGRRLRAASPHSTYPFFIWAIGVSLFVHCLSFISITYFDQLIIMWYWLLCLVAFLAQPAVRRLQKEAHSCVWTALAAEAAAFPGMPPSAPIRSTQTRDFL